MMLQKLRMVYDNVESQVRSLEALGINSDMYGPLLIPVLMAKTPTELNLMVSQKI